MLGQRNEDYLAYFNALNYFVAKSKTFKDPASLYREYYKLFLFDASVLLKFEFACAKRGVGGPNSFDNWEFYRFQYWIDELKDDVKREKEAHDKAEKESHEKYKMPSVGNLTSGAFKGINMPKIK